MDMNDKNISELTVQQPDKLKKDQQKVIKKYLKDPKNKKCEIRNISSIYMFGFVDTLLPYELHISDCPNIIFKNGALVPTKLVVTMCNIQQITDIQELTQITNLNLSFNQIREISELKELENITHLNLENNEIYRINALESLKKLQVLNLKNNKVIFSKPLENLSLQKLQVENNLIVDKIYQNQGLPTIADCQNYLGPNSTEEQANDLLILSYQHFQYHNMFQKYNKSVKTVKNINNKRENYILILKDDNELQDFYFIEQLNVNQLSIQNCPNLKLRTIQEYIYFKDKYPETQLQKPNNMLLLTSLIINKCNLSNIVVKIFTRLDYLDISDNFIGSISDLQFLQNLQYLNMSNNRIIFPDPLATLKSLKTVITTGNKIQNFEPLSQNPNFDLKWISPQHNVELQDFRDYLGFGSTEQEAQELMEKTLELKKLSYFNSPMLLKYSQQVQNKTLLIRGDQDIQGLKFVDLVDVETLFVFECNNVNFAEVPANIKKLVVNRCRLESAYGFESMNRLEELSLRGNKLTELGTLTQIKTLKILNVAQNNIKSLENVEQLQQLVELDASENAIESVEPLGTMKQLQRVNLSSNKISSGQLLEDLTNLVQLNVAFNSLESIYFVRNMELLTHLDISFNKVKDILVLKNLLKLVYLRLDRNFISMFTALNTHPNKQLGWFTCQQNVKKEDVQVRAIEKFLEVPENEKCIIQNEQDVERIDFVDIIKPKELFISGCPNVTFEHTAKVPKKLTVTKCGLNQITDIYKMSQITYLDLSFNKIRDISELAELHNLTYLNLEYNDIYRVIALQGINKLEYLNLMNNKIIFSKPVQELASKLLIENNIIVDQQYNQQEVPTYVDCYNFLGPNCIKEQYQYLHFITTVYLNNLNNIDKYCKKTENNVLKIINNNELVEFQFSKYKYLNINELNIDMLKPSELYISGCSNVTFEHAAKVPIKLTVTNCGLSQITDIYQMNQITSLNLSFNKIRDISELAELIDLTHLNLESNDIYRIEALEDLKKLEYLNLMNNKIIISQPIQNLSIKKLMINYNLIVDRMVAMFNGGENRTQ
ncbi:Conserved_hypothetical protein [Hexamita inflata]|uniref:Leucine rich repeat protein n=1 Tax=Hexamita inflata TaxID=28002 RepID=A0AA86PUL1_9EUKA|nr:Conserved hypothetical protein [Hexamita inflata]